MRFVTLFALALAGAAHAGPVARTAAGAVEGAATGDVVAFKGVPYAAPPVGPLRWRPPQPPAPWRGVRPAVDYGPDCLQKPEPTETAPPGTTSAEDCLTLNVWRPVVRGGGGKRPVLVWIHGGAFVNGGSSTPLYDGSAFARRGLVFVSLNYRLGRCGVFAHPALEQPGNFGLMDQLATLRWVQANVAAFGGDPDRVTVMGESAGGFSVLHLLTSPAASGLFRRAVVMSGGGRGMIGGLSPDEAAGIDRRWAERQGIRGDGPKALAALRALPAETACGGLNMSGLLREATTGHRTWAGGPVIDGEIVTDESGAVLRAGRQHPAPLLIGTTSDDIAALIPTGQDPLAYFGPDAEAAGDAYGLSGEALRQAVGADMMMHEPARFAAARVSASGRPAWLYRFSYVPEALQRKQAGAPHASDLAFVFDTLDAQYGAAVTARDREAARAFNAYVANFALRGEPNGPGLPDWPKYDPKRSELMNFTATGPRFRRDPWTTRLDLVERAAARAAIASLVVTLDRSTPGRSTRRRPP